MNLDSGNICHCSNESPVILKGSLKASPLNCIECKKPVLLKGTNENEDIANSINKWGNIYRSLFTLWHDSIEYRDCAKEKLLDEIGTINLEGLKLSQQHNVKRKTYYWLFQDYTNKNYVEPEHCPFCGATMESIKENDFKVCHDCMTAYPNKQPSK